MPQKLEWKDGTQLDFDGELATLMHRDKERNIASVSLWNVERKELLSHVELTTTAQARLFYFLLCDAGVTSVSIEEVEEEIAREQEPADDFSDGTLTRSKKRKAANTKQGRMKL